MSALKVGMRVKKVRGGSNIGLEGIVESVGYLPAGTLDDLGIPTERSSTVRVRYLQPWRNINGQLQRPPRIAYGQAENFEPIVPPKAQEIVSWDEMPCDRNGKYRQPEYAGVRA